MGYIGYKTEGERYDGEALLTTLGERFVKIWDFMIVEFGLEKAELLIYAVIFAMYKDYRDTFNGSREYLASWSNSSVRTVAEALKSLEKKNLIKKDYEQYGQIKKAVYYINTDMLPTCKLFSVENRNRDEKQSKRRQSL